MAEELEDKITGKESTEEMVERARRLGRRRLLNTNYHDKLPVPSQTLLLDGSKICKYLKILQNSEKSSTIKDHGGIEIEKYCSQCTGYSPTNPETKKAICPFYSWSNIPDTSKKDDKKLHILVAENEPDIQIVVETLLSVGGHAITMANDGQQAIDLIEQSQKPYDAVLTDLNMPTDGFAVLDCVRSQESYEHVPVVLMSAKVRGENRGTLIKRGFDYLIGKPFKPKVFCETVEEALKKGRLKPE